MRVHPRINKFRKLLLIFQSFLDQVFKILIITKPRRLGYKCHKCCKLYNHKFEIKQDMHYLSSNMTCEDILYLKAVSFSHSSLLILRGEFLPFYNNYFIIKQLPDIFLGEKWSSKKTLYFIPPSLGPSSCSYLSQCGMTILKQYFEMCCIQP